MTDDLHSSEVKRILCVDDDEEACAMMRILLDLYGYEVVTATSVPDALEQAALGGFGLWILDSWIGPTGGVDLCKRIRSFDQNTPIIFYSGAGFKTDIEKGLSAGAQAYITKPDFDTLERIIGEQII